MYAYIIVSLICVCQDTPVHNTEIKRGCRITRLPFVHDSVEAGEVVCCGSSEELFKYELYHRYKALVSQVL